MTTEGAPRAVCPRCRRPVVVCVCGLVPALTTQTAVLFLQHPREQRMPIGTARLAHLGLPGSQLRVGVDFAADPVVRAACARTPPPYVLFPGPGARDVHDLPAGTGPITLIVLDGTWTQAKKLLRRNPQLGALPRLAFSPRRPSGYLIRRQPADHCVSTIEALGEVLHALEPPGTPIDRLLDPFFAMVARQRRFADEVRAARHRRAPGLRPRRPPRDLADLCARATNLVCVHGEANAWPRAHPAWQPAEIVHWVAERLATGERFEALVRPRRPLAPSLPSHLGLAPVALADGLDVATWRARWQRFLRPDDVLLGWGDFPFAVAALDELPLPPAIDLRRASAQWLHLRAGPVEVMAERVGAVLPGEPTRARRRLAALSAVATAFTTRSFDAVVTVV